jgi:hypothetical protein
MYNMFLQVSSHSDLAFAFTLVTENAWSSVKCAQSVWGEFHTRIIGPNETFHISSGKLTGTETAIVAGKFRVQVIAMFSMW